MLATDRLIHALRVSGLLKQSLVHCAQRNNQTLTTWIVEALEDAAMYQDFDHLSDADQDQYRQHLREIVEAEGKNDALAFERHRSVMAKLNWKQS